MNVKNWILHNRYFTMFKDYYYNNFQRDLLEVINNRTCQYRTCVTAGEIILLDVSHFHGLTLMNLLKRMENPFNFPVAIYFTSLIPQVIQCVKDKKAMDDFHKSSSCPLISCGLGGVMDPIHTLWEAHLMPCKGCNVEQLIETIKEAEVIISHDTVEFLRGGQSNFNEKAYQNLVNSMFDKIDMVQECIHDAVLYFIDWILAPTLNTSPDSFLYTKDKNKSCKDCPSGMLSQR